MPVDFAADITHTIEGPSSQLVTQVLAGGGTRQFRATFDPLPPVEAESDNSGRLRVREGILYCLKDANVKGTSAIGRDDQFIIGGVNWSVTSQPHFQDSLWVVSLHGSDVISRERGPLRTRRL